VGEKRVSHYFSDSPTAKSSHRSKINYNFKNEFFTFWTSPGIFSPTQVDAGTRIFLEYADLPTAGSFLDLGAGYGVMGIVILKCQVEGTLVATFIENNPVAGQLIKKNLVENHCPKSEVIVSDFLNYEFRGQFDNIVCNPPLKRGLAYVEQMFTKATSLLKAGGSFQFVAMTHLGAKRLRDFLASPSLPYTRVYEKKIKSGYRVIKAEHS
jgi:16S rRNA (guanine1207-N2)-methyltransferase